MRGKGLHASRLFVVLLTVILVFTLGAAAASGADDEHEHTWELEISWNDDNSEVTATATCKDCGETVTENGKISSEVTNDPTCEEWGETTYTATFTNPVFSGPDGFTPEDLTVTQEDIEPLGHEWDYEVEWNEDNSQVTASVYCLACGKHMSETVTPVAEVTKEPTCTEWGVTTFTAEFENELFDTESFSQEDVEPLGHDWGAWTVTKKAGAGEAGEETRTCSRCGQTETRAIAALDSSPKTGDEALIWLSAMLLLASAAVMAGCTRGKQW